MQGDWQARAERRANLITQGRYDDLVDEYGYPLSIYFGEAPQVLDDRDEAALFFENFHVRLLVAGTPWLEARVTAQDMPRNGRARVWTDWYAHGPSRTPVHVASTICYSRLRADGPPLTEMFEFTHLDLPDITLHEQVA